MSIFAIQDDRVVINGVPTKHKAPDLENEKLYLARVYTSPHLGKLHEYLMLLPKTNPILIDGRVIMYTLPSRPSIGYSLLNAKDNKGPTDGVINMVVTCPIYLTHRERGGVFMERFEKIGVFEDKPNHDTMIEEF